MTGKAETTADFACEPGEAILHAGLRAGIALPYECASGTCGTCKATLVEGETSCDWPEAPGHKTVKAERHEFLMCQTRAISDVSIAIAKRVADAAQTRVLPSLRGGILVDLERLTHDVVSFSVVLDEPMDFAAGQFALFSVDDVRGARSYSMVNFDAGAQTLSFLVKRFPGGKLSDWLFDGTRDGTAVRLFGPLGSATFDPALELDVCCLAGGSGIAGMMAMLEHARAIDYFARFRGNVVFGVRTCGDVFFLDELSAFVRSSHDNLRITIAISNEIATAELRERYPLLQFDTGFVHDVARPTCTSAAGSMFFVAGPPPMVDASLRMLLLDAKAPGDRIRYDKFS